MAAIDDAVRVHQNLALQQDKQLASAAAPFAAGVPSLHLTFQRGAKVLDLVTGKTGVVIDGYRENVIVPAAVSASEGSGESAAG